MEEKPWLNINLHNRYIGEYINRKHYEDIINDIISYMIIQECNQAGIYFRILMWTDKSEKRYYITEGENDWHFNKKLVIMKEGEEIEELKSRKKYNVNNKFKNEFIKILELIN
jgi:hypothetical protein